MLETYVPLEELPVGEKPKILSVGCGISYEALVLSGHLEKNQVAQIVLSRIHWDRFR